MFDVSLGAVRIEIDSDHVDASPLDIQFVGFAVPDSRLPHAPKLGRNERLRRHVGGSAAGPDLDENDVVAVLCYEVDLNSADAGVSVEYSHPLRFEPVSGDTFAEITEPAP